MTLTLAGLLAQVCSSDSNSGKFTSSGLSQCLTLNMPGLLAQVGPSDSNSSNLISSTVLLKLAWQC